MYCNSNSNLLLLTVIIIQRDAKVDHGLPEQVAVLLDCWTVERLEHGSQLSNEVPILSADRFELDAFSRSGSM